MTGVGATIWLGKLLVHEKAVPPMIGVCKPKTLSRRNGKWARKEASPPATAGQVAARFDAGVSHTRGFQASAKCGESAEIPALGPAPAAVDPLADDLLLGRQFAGKIRGRQRVLRGLLSQKETPRKVLCGFRESRRQTSHARAAGIGCGHSGPLPSDLRRKMEGGRALFPWAATVRGRTARAARNSNDAWAPAARRARRQ